MMRIDPKLMLLTCGFAVLVACQTMVLGSLAAVSEPPPMPVEDCRTAEQPPWIDEEPSLDPCPLGDATSG